MGTRQLMIMMMIVVVVAYCSEYNENNTLEAKRILNLYDSEMLPAMAHLTDLGWRRLAGDDNVTENDMNEAKRKVVEARNRYQSAFKYFLLRQQRVRSDIWRELKLVNVADLDQESATQLEISIQTMRNFYKDASYCRNLDKQICEEVSNDIIKGFAEEKNVDKLHVLWSIWHNSLSDWLSPHFKKSVPLLNKMAKMIPRRDYSEEMMKTYEGYVSKTDLVTLFAYTESLYELLHSYVRTNLHKHFKSMSVSLFEVISRDGPLPVTLLGDIFGRTWGNLYKDMIPYPSAREANLTYYMSQVSEHWRWMYEWTQERFLSMNLHILPFEFYIRSILEATNHTGRCEPSAWNMYTRTDFRVYFCTEVTETHLERIVYLLANLQYFHYTSHLPIHLRSPPNEAFQEAISLMFTLAFLNPTHIYRHGFFNIKINEVVTDQIQINFLLRVALGILPALPSFLALDVWRWKVYSEVYRPEEWNCEYWKLRHYLSGVVPASPRNESSYDMLPTHQTAHTKTASKHFTAIFMAFQIFEGLCDEESHTGPLHTCDLYSGKDAGTKLILALTQGASKPWPDIYKILTGSRHISAKPLLRFFKPLRDWLKKEAERTGAVIGWTHHFPPVRVDSGASGGVRRLLWWWWCKQCAVLLALYSITLAALSTH